MSRAARVWLVVVLLALVLLAVQGRYSTHCSGGECFVTDRWTGRMLNAYDAARCREAR